MTKGKKKIKWQSLHTQSGSAFSFTPYHTYSLELSEFSERDRKEENTSQMHAFR